MHRLTLRDFELTAISDGTYHLDGGVFFGVVPKIMWERKVKADEKNRVPSGLNSVLVRTGDRSLLDGCLEHHHLREQAQQARRQPGEAPYTLLDFLPADSLIFVDESHVAVPQVGGMLGGAVGPANRAVVAHGQMNRPLLTLDLDGHAKEWLGQKGYDPAYGARPLKRVIQKYVQDPLAEMVLAGKIHDGDKVKITAGKDGLMFNGAAAKAKAA